METKNNILIAGLVLLIVGFGGGYIVATATTKQIIPGAMHQMPDGSMMSGGNMHSTMAGMTMGLEGKTGAELEKAFLDEMIVHHEGAITMAETLRSGTTRPELLKLANDIITAQRGEIELMKEWRRDWFGN